MCKRSRPGRLSCKTILAYIQGRLFEKAGSRFPAFDSEAFIRLFMRGPGRLLDRLGPEFPLCHPVSICMTFYRRFQNPPGSAYAYCGESMFWIGYVYRVWQVRTKIPSAEIVKIADPDFMFCDVWRVVDERPVAAIREIYRMKGLTPPDGL